MALAGVVGGDSVFYTTAERTLVAQSFASLSSFLVRIAFRHLN
jgi:hypothetical protein